MKLYKKSKYLSFVLLLIGLSNVACQPIYQDNSGSYEPVPVNPTDLVDLEDSNVSVPSQTPLSNSPLDHTSSWIAFASDIESWGETKIFVVRPDGTSLSQLTNGADENDSQPAWSPDGVNIAFVRRHGNPASKGDIFILNIETKEIIQLTYTDYDEAAPSWSPDGKMIAYMADQEGNFDIFVRNLETGNSLQLTTNSDYDELPSWSPDGTKLVFSRNGNLFVLDTTCIAQPTVCETTLVQITDFSEKAWGAKWSPDGLRIAFSAISVGHAELWLINADGTNSMQVTHSELPKVAPEWSPDGRYLAYTVGGPPPYELFILDLTCIQSLSCDEANLSIQLTDSRDAPNGSLSPTWIQNQDKPSP